MQKQPSLTIISATGHSGYTRGSMFAIHRSYLALKDKIADLRCVLISPDRPADLPEQIRHIQCSLMTYKEYNAFSFLALGQFVETDFALIVQNDGCVLHGNMWTDEFFQYDYIGAPVCHYYYNNEVVSKEVWSQNFRVPAPEGMAQMFNGGFCLRSKKLLDAPRVLGLPYQVSVIGANLQEPVSLEKRDDNCNEDVLLTGVYRQQLEQYGCRFPPYELALRFSIEFFQAFATYKYYFPESDIGFRSLGSHSAGGFVLTDWNEFTTMGPFPFNTFDEILTMHHVKIRLDQGYALRIPAQFSPNGKDTVIRLESQN